MVNRRYQVAALGLICVIAFSLLVVYSQRRTANADNSKPNVPPLINITSESIWIHTSFYRVRLDSGVITVFEVNGSNILLGSAFGLGMNEVAYTSHFLYLMQSRYDTVYTVINKTEEIIVRAFQDDIAGWESYPAPFYASFNNTWIFRNSTPIIEVFTTRVLDFNSVRSSAHQICFVFERGEATAYFDDTHLVHASNYTGNLDSFGSSSAGYILNKNVKFTIQILDKSPSNCSFYDSTLGGSNYDEIQITWFKLGDSASPIATGNVTECIHYTMSFLEV
jgi:hypothetical protein